MKRTLISAAIAAAAVLAIPATAQMGYGGYGPGYGMGPGMMGGYGPGYGMMGGYGPGYGYGNLNLTSEQRSKVAEIQQALRKKQWALMQSMHEIRWNQADAYKDGKLDENAARKSFEAMTELRKQMFENSLAARKSMDSVLTPEQRKQLGEGR
ncbi:MAG TPA: Spy/CpxP family protein refolding chaperone [Burkholderiales bacterium]|jgi:Spy/CpxP family protein refolding chaperone|nr:Spy/CpxP family protein refolding chaperone [Burkholderiales bacterium]